MFPFLHSPLLIWQVASTSLVSSHVSSIVQPMDVENVHQKYRSQWPIRALHHHLVVLQAAVWCWPTSLRLPVIPLYERTPHTNSVMIVLKLVSLACVLLQFSGCCVVGLSSSFPVVVAVELHVESETINNEIKLLQHDRYHMGSRSVSGLH